jgi:hypothetical protein
MLARTTLHQERERRAVNIGFHTLALLASQPSSPPILTIILYHTLLTRSPIAKRALSNITKMTTEFVPNPKMLVSCPSETAWKIGR